MGRPSGKDALIEQVKTLYVEEKLSLGEIREVTGKSQQTLSRWLQDEGIAIEPRPRNANAGRTPEQQALINAKVSASRKGKGTGPRKATPPISSPKRVRVARSLEPRQCENCPKTFQPSTDTQRYCGRPCARAADAARASQAKREAYEANPNRCPCSAAIPYEVRHSVKYCNMDCRKEYGVRKEANPENYLTFECLGCGTKVTRRKKYSTYTKYCSNACAAKHTKTKTHIVVDDAVVLDSGYEALLWGLCSVYKVPIDRYDRDGGVEWREGGWYAPDFLVSCHGRQVAVETKGLEDPEDQERWAAFRGQSDIPLVVLTRKSLMPPPASRDDLLKLLRLA